MSVGEFHVIMKSIGYYLETPTANVKDETKEERLESLKVATKLIL